MAEDVSLDDFYCLKVDRYGALGALEYHKHEHALTREQAAALARVHVETLGPGDRAEFTLTRGIQHEPDR